MTDKQYDSRVATAEEAASVLSRLDTMARVLADLKTVGDVRAQAPYLAEIGQPMIRTIRRLDAENAGLRNALTEIAETTIHFSETDTIDENWRRNRARAALNLMPCGHPKSAVVGRTTQFCGECAAESARAKQE